ncbi:MULTISPECIES: GNAT family N-acetyltransferase [unclassified Streptomyces]|uniref:GNAT family N-acetyltransferase n=1 Tax=unclassified Streptomyces TaxID=2593676 RepID=UPI0001C18A90|nr:MULTISPECIES: GNAT family N-acetyltransferase [unclassified Streptomyces]AEN12935.1 GCN5-related N-acetyltransferase [Streptomyces sp. SirexAA-E]MYR66071.1 GNAT family N-acetyltransferase [Streptomyces sp. SID4939]MYS00995.1 GNAT family N-acetyltransferase [Streptomyces sp. SID4940]MYT65804.1 GNAT family N-acetyltransferase [Streptomyces sp. SID8357]MYT84160.1 GNAT family N-acetyltransferase [Streptomyces sp. SID8360]
MTWTFTDDVGVFLDAAGPSPAARPVENTLLLTVTATLARHGPHAYGEAAPVLGWWRGADGEVGGTLVRTPPHPAVLGTVAPQAIGPLLDACPLPVVNADRATAEALTARHGGRVDAGHRLYRLDVLVPPPPVPGLPRVATAADRALLVAWVRAFGAETGQPGAGAERLVDDRLGHGGLTLWEAGGLPVSMAGVSRPVAGTVRVSAVYTPREHRGAGYAAAVTAEVSRAAREAGAEEVLLFADLANPTSNGVYRRIGFEAVCDRLIVTLAPA